MEALSSLSGCLSIARDSTNVYKIVGWLCGGVHGSQESEGERTAFIAGVWVLFRLVELIGLYHDARTT